MVDDNGIETTLLKRYGGKIIGLLGVIVVALAGYVWDGFNESMESLSEDVKAVKVDVEKIDRKVDRGLVTDSMLISDMNELKEDFKDHKKESNR